MADLTLFAELFNEDESSIRARMDESVNAEVAIDSDAFVDTRVGLFFHLTTQPAVIEIARMYDEASMRVAAAMIEFAWGDHLDRHAAGVALARKPAVSATGVETFSGVAATFIPAGTQVTPEQIDPAAPAPVFLTDADATIAAGTLLAPGSVDVPVTAQGPGSASNAAAASVTVLRTPVAGQVVSILNADPISGGADQEDDESLRQRVLDVFLGNGPGNVADLTRWALERPGVYRVTVRPNWAGENTVQVVVKDANGDAVGPAIVADVQQFLDPVLGQGHGRAPIGMRVTVTTSTTQVVPIAATVQLETGYSLDGDGATIALRAALEAAVRDYVDALNDGDDVVVRHAQAQLFRVTGVHDALVTLPSDDVAIDATVVPRAGTITLALGSV